MGKQWKQWLALFGGRCSKVTADGDCSHELKRHLFLGRKDMTNLNSISKNRDIILPTKVHLIKSMISPVVMHGCESWTIMKAECIWRTVWRFLKKLEIELPYDPAIPLLGIHTEETRIERDTCTPLFIAALFPFSNHQFAMK